MVEGRSCGGCLKNSNPANLIPPLVQLQQVSNQLYNEHKKRDVLQYLPLLPLEQQYICHSQSVPTTCKGHLCVIIHPGTPGWPRFCSEPVHPSRPCVAREITTQTPWTKLSPPVWSTLFPSSSDRTSRFCLLPTWPASMMSRSGPPKSTPPSRRHTSIDRFLA